MGHSLKLKEARERTPAVDACGAWAEKLREAATTSISENDMKDVMASLVERAKKGDNGATKLLLSYLAPPAAAAKPAPLPPEVSEILEMVAERLRSGGLVAGTREAGDHFDVLVPVGQYPTEQEAEKAARRLSLNGSNGRNGQ